MHMSMKKIVAVTGALILCLIVAVNLYVTLSCTPSTDSGIDEEPASQIVSTLP